jgi:uncharacterized membrane protein
MIFGSEASDLAQSLCTAGASYLLQIFGVVGAAFIVAAGAWFAVRIVLGGVGRGGRL